MTEKSHFSDSECRLILQLLQRERAELPVEIHHSEVPEAKEHLRRRLHEIDRVIEKTKSFIAPPA